MAAVAVGPLTLNVLHAPKEGNTENQYEDAYAFSVTDDRATVVVADGASSAVFAREWANLLVDAFSGSEEGPEGEAHPFPEEDAAVAQRLWKRWARHGARPSRENRLPGTRRKNCRMVRPPRFW